jgi:uncharacterized protein (DUF2236 family)
MPTLDEAYRGHFGPESVTWRVAREAALFLGGPRALMLQIAHPAVAAAVEAHSDFRADPLGRGQRTFDIMHAIIFGDREDAARAITRMTRRHVPVHGTIAEPSASPWSGRGYAASEPTLLLWVHATLIDTALRVYQRTVRRLAADEAERYWQESRLLGELFGIPRADLPLHLADFRAYMREMLAGPTLQVGPIARGQWEALAGSSPSQGLASIYGRAWAERWQKLVDRAPFKASSAQLTHLLGAGKLPSRLRQAFGYDWGRREQLAYQAVLSLAGAVVPRLPARLRFVPSYRTARVRVQKAQAQSATRAPSVATQPA